MHCLELWQGLGCLVSLAVVVMVVVVVVMEMKVVLDEGWSWIRW